MYGPLPPVLLLACAQSVTEDADHVWCTIHRQKTSSALFFKYNSQLGPPYQVLLDTNFINFAIKNKVGPA